MPARRPPLSGRVSTRTAAAPPLPLSHPIPTTRAALTRRRRAAPSPTAARVGSPWRRWTRRRRRTAPQRRPAPTRTSSTTPPRRASSPAETRTGCSARWSRVRGISTTTCWPLTPTAPAQTGARRPRWLATARSGPPLPRELRVRGCTRRRKTTPAATQRCVAPAPATVGKVPPRIFFFLRLIQ